MPDFSELAAYLSEQIDIGEDKVYLDEPWSIAPKAPAIAMPAMQAPAAASPMPSFTMGRPAPSVAAPAPKPRPVLSATSKIVIPEAAKSAVPSAYESAESLEKFYSLVAGEKLYANTQFAKGEGKLENPKLLLVVYSPLAQYSNGYANSEAGQMVSRLFGSLKIAAEEIGVTYFCKKSVARAVLPQVSLVFRKMLEKEVSLIRPQTIVFFGDKLLKQALSQNAKAVDFGGTPLEFAKVPATVLIDPEEMLSNKQLKMITWKTHIPKCGFFG